MGIGVQEKVHHIVGERAADEKFHGEVIHALGVVARISALGINPSPRQKFPHGERERLESFVRRRARQADDLVDQQVLLVQDLVQARRSVQVARVLVQSRGNSIGLPGLPNRFRLLIDHATSASGSELRIAGTLPDSDWNLMNVGVLAGADPAQDPVIVQSARAMS